MNVQLSLKQFKWKFLVVFRKKFYFFDQSILFAVGLLIIQQLIVASSTIWITNLISGIQQGYFSYPFLAMYLASLVLPYFPGAAAIVEIAKTKSMANVQFINQFSNIYRGQVATWTKSSDHFTTASILTGEVPQTINGYLDYIYHFTSCGLNVFFNLIVIAFIIEPWLLISYLVGIGLAFLVLKIQNKSKKILSLRAQQGRIKWTSMLLKAWDNILIDNIYNFNIWERKTSQRGKRLIGSNVKLESLSQTVSIAMAFLLLAPSFALICYLPAMHNYNLNALAVMVVALPRLFQVLSYSYDMLFVLSDLPMQKSRLKTIAKLLDSPDLKCSKDAYKKLEERIQWDKIQINGNESISPKSFITSIPSCGRYTIKGSNGAGKSSFLLLLKMIKRHEAFYLPVKHDLVFKLSKDGFSTGQLVRKILNEILEKIDTSIILLDEWDANLDIVNQHKLSELIDRMSIDRCVIEVRHK